MPISFCDAGTAFSVIYYRFQSKSFSFLRGCASRRSFSHVSEATGQRMDDIRPPLLFRQGAVFG